MEKTIWVRLSKFRVVLGTSKPEAHYNLLASSKSPAYVTFKFGLGGHDEDVHADLVDGGDFVGDKEVFADYAVEDLGEAL